ncbi:conserved hypothetical protein [Histoplasma mississippiense (nom. inval.)]|nr:conserved hypothetical protein [Histoplasma mississippiense (nom. inval.)]EDN02360.1 conserved hypothetical protein [Histoplasma mississippiense (nom. inval.)]
MKAQYIVIGLDALEIANFPVIGRGVRTLQHFKPPLSVDDILAMYILLV